MLVEVVQVPLVGLGVELPDAVLLVGEDDVLRARLRFGRAPHVVVAVRIVRAAACGLEPRVRVRRVVHDEVDDHPDAVGSGRADEFDEVAERPEAGVDTVEVRDVVAVVLAGGGVEGHEPQARHAEVGEVLDAVRHAADVAGAVAVRVVKGLDVGAVEHGVLPPEVAGVRAPHVVTGCGVVADICGSTCSPNASMKSDCCWPTKCRYNSSQP